MEQQYICPKQIKDCQCENCEAQYPHIRCVDKTSHCPKCVPYIVMKELIAPCGDHADCNECINKADCDNEQKQILIAEAKEIINEHPSKDAKYFARQVIKYLEGSENETKKKA